MKPKEYLAQLEKDKPRATDDLDFAYRQGLYDGAQRMWELMNKKERAWRERNREKLRQYSRAYARARRAKEKMMKEDIDKIANMK